LLKEIKIYDVIAKPGELKFGRIPGIELGTGAVVDIPLMVMNGVDEGPTLMVSAGAHGTEVTGIECIRRIMREELNPNKLRGVVIAVPASNPIAVNAATYFTHEFDGAGGNLIQSFPGAPDHDATKLMAYRLWQVITQAHYYIDLHCTGYCIPYTHVRTNGYVDNIPTRKALAMAKAFGTTIVHPSPRMLIGHATRTNFGLATSVGIPSIAPELPGWKAWDKKAADVGVRGVLNVLKHLDMIDGSIEKQVGYPVITEELYNWEVNAARGGLLREELKPGDRVCVGDVIARVFNMYGDEVEAIKSPKDGYITCYSHFRSMVVATGDGIGSVGALKP